MKLLYLRGIACFLFMLLIFNTVYSNTEESLNPFKVDTEYALDEKVRTHFISVTTRKGECVEITYKHQYRNFSSLKDAKVKIYNIHSEHSKHVDQEIKIFTIPEKEIVALVMIFEQYEVFSLPITFETPATGRRGTTLGGNYWLSIKWNLGEEKKGEINRMHKGNSVLLDLFLNEFLDKIDHIQKTFSQQGEEADPILHGNFVNEPLKL